MSFGNQRVGVVERREAQTPAAGEAALVKNGTNHDTLRLQKRRIKHQRSILLFMSDPNIPFHNNSSERAIRMAKVKQKISGGFRSKRGAERHAVLLSMSETAKKQGLNILEAIQGALNQSLVFEGARYTRSKMKPRFSR